MSASTFVRDQHYQINKEIRDGYASDGGRGTLIPSATDLGGSRGFNVQGTMPMTVDPEYPTRHVFDPAEGRAGMVPLPGSRAPIQLNIAPQAIPQELSSIDIQPRPGTSPQGASTLSASSAPAAALSQLPTRKAPAPESLVVGPPATKIVFDFDRMGAMTTYYHEIVRDGDNLILVWDTRYQGPVYEPPKLDQELKIQVGDRGDRMVVALIGIAFTLPRYQVRIHVLPIIEA